MIDSRIKEYFEADSLRYRLAMENKLPHQSEDSVIENST